MSTYILHGGAAESRNIDEPGALHVFCNDKWLKSRFFPDILYHNCAPDCSDLPEIPLNRALLVVLNSRGLKFKQMEEWAERNSHVTRHGELFEEPELRERLAALTQPGEHFGMQFTGVYALWDLLKTADRIRVTGFDFFAQVVKAKPRMYYHLRTHNCRANALLTEDLAQDPRVELDSQARQAIEFWRNYTPPVLG